MSPSSLPFSNGSRCSKNFDIQAALSEESANVVQVVRQVNFGSLESKRYFVSTPSSAGSVSFREITENDLIQANYEKLNS